MKKGILLTLLSIAMSLPALADGDRHQSFISYDDGGSVIRQADDNHEVEARRNMPVYPGDELVTGRRGRTEVRLSDGNIVGVDRATAIRFRSILDSYEGEANETIAELRYGKVAVYRTDIGQDHVRLDTSNASYVAENEAVYSVETDQNGRDRVTVFDGSVDVRTPRRSTRLRQGEAANVDDRGVSDLIGDQGTSADDFERWFLRRAEKFENYNNRYVDRRLGYYTDDLDDYGSWVFVTGVGYSWRPFVGAGWRPYYNGYWHHSRYGSLTWVSYDPWGWGTYHYGRWAYDPGYGWVWVPGYGYSPAWVYWWYGPSYIGWAPSGYWDCSRGYYDWAYRPYRNRDWGAGFYGRVRISEMDLRPWTFVDSNTIVSNRIDRAALTTDAVKQRLGRSRDGFATIGSGSTRWTNDALRDPAEEIHRRGLDGRVTGRETGSGATAGAPDMTPFFRRDGDLNAAVRDRIVRSRGGSSTPATGSTPSRAVGSGGGGIGSITGGGSVGVISRGSNDRGTDRGDVTRGTDRNTGTVDRSGSGSANVPDASTGRDTSWRNRGGDRGAGTIDRGGSSADRGSVDRGTSSGGGTVDRGSSTGRGAGSIDRGSSTPGDSTATPRNDGWRSRPRTDDRSSGGSSAGSSSGSSSGPSSARGSNSGSSDVPRRVIDRSGGARIYPRDSSSSGGSSTRDRSSGSSSRGDSGSRSSGGSSSRGGDSGSRGGGARNDGGGSSRGSSNSGGSSNRGGDSGGHVNRDH